MVDDWLRERIKDMWPTLPEAQWMSRLASFAASNEFLFVTNGRGVLCAEQKPHAMTMRPLVIEVFAWSRGARLANDGTGDWTVPERSDQVALAQLYRYARDWMRSMKGFRFIAGTCSDLSPGVLLNLTDGRYMVDIR
jgi:hypothetical protein